MNEIYYKQINECLAKLFTKTPVKILSINKEIKENKTSFLVRTNLAKEIFINNNDLEIDANEALLDDSCFEKITITQEKKIEFIIKHEAKEIYKIFVKEEKELLKKQEVGIEKIKEMCFCKNKQDVSLSFFNRLVIINYLGKNNEKHLILNDNGQIVDKYNDVKFENMMEFVMHSEKKKNDYFFVDDNNNNQANTKVKKLNVFDKSEKILLLKEIVNNETLKSTILSINNTLNTKSIILNFLIYLIFQNYFSNKKICFDLNNNVAKDYFYILYTYCRICGILRNVSQFEIEKCLAQNLGSCINTTILNLSVVEIDHFRSLINDLICLKSQKNKTNHLVNFTHKLTKIVLKYRIKDIQDISLKMFRILHVLVLKKAMQLLLLDIFIVAPTEFM